MKKVIALCFVFACLLCAAGCMTTEKENSGPHTNIHSDFPGVEAHVSGISTEKESATIDVTWINRTQYDVMYGEPYSIERLEGGEWVGCSKNENNAFITIGYKLSAGDEISKKYRISDLFDVSVPGTYRFKSSCAVYAGGERSQICHVWTEFTLENGNSQDDDQKISTKVQWCARYIRTDGHQDDGIFPRAVVIDSLQELKDYYTAYHEIFDLERRDTVYADTTLGFLDACDTYDAAYFEKNFLVFVLLEEVSGSVRHEVLDVEWNEKQKLSVSINRKVPEEGTDDMAQWHIILELGREIPVDAPEDIRVYLDGDLFWDGGPRYPVMPIAAIKDPRKASASGAYTC